MKKICKKDVTFKRVSYSTNSRDYTTIEVSVFGKRVGYMHLISRFMGYQLEIDKYDAFENLYYRPEVGTYGEVREILRGQLIDLQML